MLDASDAAEDYKRHERSKLDALLGWCEVTGCRRRPLLEYFGDTPPGDCGNCDGCLTPVDTWDGTVEAQKLLSAVYRTGQRLGAVHVVDVLLGKATDKIAQHGHANLSVYGIGSDLSADRWRSVIRQLIVRGYLRSDPERFGALVLTPQSRALLRGEVTVRFREDPKKPLKVARTPRPVMPVADEDRDLFEALRACRQRLAGAHGVPPYVIFHDRTLKEMVALKPASEAEMLDITGVGQTKLERFGKDFLDVLQGA